MGRALGGVGKAGLSVEGAQESASLLTQALATNKRQGKVKDVQVQEQGCSLSTQRQPLEERNVVPAPTVLYMHESTHLPACKAFLLKMRA